MGRSISAFFAVLDKFQLTKIVLATKRLDSQQPQSQGVGSGVKFFIFLLSFKRKFALIS